MDRRAVLCGSTAVLSGLTAGCLDDRNAGTSGEETTAEEDDGGSPADENATVTEDGDDGASIDPETTCETVDAILEAIVAGEYDVAASFAPTAHIEELEEDDLRREYEALEVPNEALDRSCETAESGEEFLDVIERNVGDQVAVGDGNEVEIDLGNSDATIEGFAVELDGDWDGWIDVDRSSDTEARAAVEIDSDGEAFSITVVAIDNADYVTLGGEAAAFDANEYGPNDADDLSGVELTVGHQVTVDGTDLSSGDFDGTVAVIAVREADDVRTTVASHDVEIAAAS